MSEKLVRIKNRIDTADNWTSVNPVLAAGEIGIDSTNLNIKIGDGSTNWNEIVPIAGKNVTQYIHYDLKGMPKTKKFSLFQDTDVTGNLVGNILIIFPGYVPLAVPLNLGSTGYSLSVGICPLSNANVTGSNIPLLNIDFDDYDKTITFDSPGRLLDLGILDSNGNFKWGQIQITARQV